MVCVILQGNKSQVEPVHGAKAMDTLCEGYLDSAPGCEGSSGRADSDRFLRHLFDFVGPSLGHYQLHRAWARHDQCHSASVRGEEVRF